MNLANLTPTERKAIGEVTAWARQSIAFAMSIRDSESKRQFDNSRIAQLACSEANNLTDDLWTKAVKECGENAAIQQVTTAYTKRVFEWCQTHLHP